MKILFYYIALLVFIALLVGFMLAKSNDSTMSMPEMLGICTALAAYVVGMSLVGEGKSVDERETAHRYTSARVALIAGTAFLSLAVIYQIFSYELDYWLLAGLIVINLSKIVSLIYLNYKR